MDCGLSTYSDFQVLVGANLVDSPGFYEHGSKGEGKTNGKSPSSGLKRKQSVGVNCL